MTGIATSNRTLQLPEGFEKVNLSKDKKGVKGFACRCGGWISKDQE